MENKTYIEREKAIAYVEEQYRLFKDNEEKQFVVEGCVEALKFTPVADVVSKNEFAKEIIAEIDNRLNDMAMEYANAGHKAYFAVCEMVYHKVLRKVEKKYTQECEGLKSQMSPKRTTELLNKVIDQMIEREGMKPRAVIVNLLELGFTADELIELNFAADEVLDLATEYANESTLDAKIAAARGDKSLDIGDTNVKSVQSEKNNDLER